MRICECPFCHGDTEVPDTTRFTESSCGCGAWTKLGPPEDEAEDRAQIEAREGEGVEVRRADQRIPPDGWILLFWRPPPTTPTGQAPAGGQSGRLF